METERRLGLGTVVSWGSKTKESQRIDPQMTQIYADSVLFLSA
jgi:hypothetical protein